MGPVEVIAALGQLPSGPPQKDLCTDRPINSRVSIYTDRTSRKSSCELQSRLRATQGIASRKLAAAPRAPSDRSLTPRSVVQSVTAPTEADDTCAAYLASTPRV